MYQDSDDESDSDSNGLDEDDDDDDITNADDENMRDDGMTALERMEKRQDEEVMWPDEVDVRPHEKARETFRGWRGLQSFRASPWDADENLPPAYARLYAFASFTQSAKAVRRQVLQKSCLAGTYVRLWLKVPLVARCNAVECAALLPSYAALRASNFGVCVDPNMSMTNDDGSISQLLVLFAALAKAAAANAPLVVSGLLKHERKTTVMHTTVKRHPSYEAPVRNGDQFLFVCGFRRFVARPIFSSNARGVDKQKMERFLQPGTDAVASFYSSIIYSPCPVLMLKRSQSLIGESKLNLVAVGSILKPNPRRIMLRKAVLTGVPIRCHKRFAIVRGMFHTREDIEYYKPIEVWTKMGRTGHIKEAIGTHGRMKVVFDGHLNPNDTVCLSLYARQYPPFDVSQNALARDALLVNQPFVPMRYGGEGVRAQRAKESDDVDLPVGGGVIASGK
mmetsp:Transcript_5456/g.9100  ORF Transcript_5456/g.9100 Transcript_5456/m.9100 type:complete len:450 (-) Transcript_5456:28-1377(-)